MSSAFDEMIDATATLEGMCAAGGAEKTKGKRKMNLSEILERQDKIKEIYGDIRAALLDVSDRLEELKNIADEIELDKLELTAAEFEKLIKHGITLGAKIRVVSAYNSPFHTITGIRADGFIATSLDNDVSIVGRRELEHLDKIEVMK